MSQLKLWTLKGREKQAVEMQNCISNIREELDRLESILLNEEIDRI